MIKKAKELSCEIDFYQCDVNNLTFDDNTFDSAIFSFNGLMQIPGIKNRLKALKEINRILTKGGLFIFTTHDRVGPNGEFKKFWDQEKIKWNNDEQDSRLINFGDIQIRKHGIDTYIHIPTRKEIIDNISKAGFKLVDNIIRSQVCKENDQVHNFSNDCRFYIVQKET